MTWTLQAIRDHNVADPLGGLGSVAEPKKEAATTPPPFEHYMRSTTLPDNWRDALEQTFEAGREVGRSEAPKPTTSSAPLDTTTEEPGAHGFLRPLKVGDTLRLGQRWSGNYEHLRGLVVTVARVDEHGRFWTSDDPQGRSNHMGYVDEQGCAEYWERVA